MVQNSSSWMYVKNIRWKLLVAKEKMLSWKHSATSPHPLLLLHPHLPRRKNKTTSPWYTLHLLSEKKKTYDKYTDYFFSEIGAMIIYQTYVEISCLFRKGSKCHNKVCELKSMPGLYRYLCIRFFFLLIIRNLRMSRKSLWSSFISLVTLLSETGG